MGVFRRLTFELSGRRRLGTLARAAHDGPVPPVAGHDSSPLRAANYGMAQIYFPRRR